MDGVALFRAVLGLILVSASVGKLSSSSAFVKTFANLEAVPRLLRRSVAHLLPVIELGLGVSLLIGFQERLVLVLASGLFLAFGLVGAVELLHMRGGNTRTECGCLGGIGGLTITRGSVMANIGIAASGIAAALSYGSLKILELGLFMGWSLAVLASATYWLVLYGLSVLAMMAQASGEGVPT
jgi:hypothetical protein